MAIANHFRNIARKTAGTCLDSLHIYLMPSDQFYINFMSLSTTPEGLTLTRSSAKLMGKEVTWHTTRNFWRNLKAPMYIFKRFLIFELLDENSDENWWEFWKSKYSQKYTQVEEGWTRISLWFPKAKDLTTNNMLFTYKLKLLGFEWAILQSLRIQS